MFRFTVHYCLHISGIPISEGVVLHSSRCAEDVGGGAVACESLEEAVRGADVVVTVTLATQPLVCGKWIKKGAVVCCKQFL